MNHHVFRYLVRPDPNSFTWSVPYFLSVRSVPLSSFLHCTIYWKKRGLSPFFFLFFSRRRRRRKRDEKGKEKRKRKEGDEKGKERTKEKKKKEERSKQRKRTQDRCQLFICSGKFTHCIDKPTQLRAVSVGQIKVLNNILFKTFNSFNHRLHHRTTIP